MGRGGNEKPGPNLSLLPFFSPSFSHSPLSGGIEKGVTVCVRVWVCVCAHICVFITLTSHPHLLAPSHHHFQHHLPPFLSLSLFAAVFIFHLQFYFFISRGGAAEQIQLGSMIGPLAFSGVMERLKNSVAQTWLWLCSIWSEVRFVTAKWSPLCFLHWDHRFGPKCDVRAVPRVGSVDSATEW